MRRLKYCLLAAILLSGSCTLQSSEKEKLKLKVGAAQTGKYISLLKDKKIAIVANHTTTINSVHLVDSLLSLGIDIQKIFSPEHGFRGNADAGEHVKNYTDEKTGLPVISLYGNSKKPELEDLKGLDIVVFDLQDVGVRYYTYISTMHYVMEACAEMNVELLILDRPNPNGFYVDGPVLDTSFSSFVGMHPVPIVHGMTIAEYAQMINGEGWLKDGKKCKLAFIPCANYTHDSLYQLPVNPSPNLQNMRSVYLYPSLGFFEGTSFSAGRGTEFPFQVYGSPDYQNRSFSFTPVRTEGASKYPKHRDKVCFGVDLRTLDMSSIVKRKEINLEWILDAYNNTLNKGDFFNNFFYNITGNKDLREQIESGLSEDEIRESWQDKLNEFKKIRKKYLLYKE